jgi:pilus assembly protein CpaC
VQGLKNPIILTRRAQATVELGSGDTFALAGLLKSDESNNVDKFPGLGELPVLGTLFRSQQFRNDKTELVILVTPYLVRPVADREKMLTPHDGYVPPSDLQRLLIGNIYQQEPMNEEQSAPTLHGDGGFMLDEE